MFSPTIFLRGVVDLNEFSYQSNRENHYSVDTREKNSRFWKLQKRFSQTRKKYDQCLEVFINCTIFIFSTFMKLKRQHAM